jgi:hypothetical protein
MNFAHRRNATMPIGFDDRGIAEVDLDAERRLDVRKVRDQHRCWCRSPAPWRSSPSSSRPVADGGTGAPAIGTNDSISSASDGSTRPNASRPVSRARHRPLPSTLPTGMPAFRNAGPIARACSTGPLPGDPAYAHAFLRARLASSTTRQPDRPAGFSNLANQKFDRPNQTI